METNERARNSLQADDTEEPSFDEMAKGFADGTTSREHVLKWLGRTLLGGGMLALVPSMAGAGGHKNGKDGKRGKHHGGGGKHHGSGGGGGACPATCPSGALTVAPTAHGECRCVAVSPGLRDPAFACGGRVNANGAACCFCLFNAEGEGFCAVNTDCDVFTGSFARPCTSSGECVEGWKCVLDTPILVETRPTAGSCWPECHATEAEGVFEVKPAP
jgi:hypothetical protein